ncbi:MAG: penicillin-binding protein, partial [Firmicutes bacterium]|nr:penicillin-binding protein [Bacillota bacterium]
MNHYEDKENVNMQSGEGSVQHSRRRKKEEEKKNKKTSRREKFEAKQSVSDSAASSVPAASGSGGDGGNHNKKKKKYRLNWKRIILLCFCLCLLAGVAVVGWVASIIMDTPDIDTSDINSMLTQSSTLYDDKGEVIDTVVGSDGAKRTIVSISQIPDNLQNAFIALEDKTFRDHNGFNIIRIFGAIKDGLLTGDISGTSTLTQQLARNVYLPDEAQKKSLERKVKEAYYTIILEKRLNKDQILEAYLNTVNFGQAFGAQAAAQVYYSKDVEDLTLAECAALAAMPQLPGVYQMVEVVPATEITDETENLIAKDGDVAYLWNDAADGRMQICLDLMLEQGYIDQEEYEEASAVEIKDIVNPNTEMLKTKTNYFADYVIKTVMNDLQEELGYDYDKAHDLVYSSGIKIYTTMNTEMQEIIEKELSNDANFPTLVVSKKDGNGNILDDYGNVMLYKYSNYITSKGYFRLTSS